MARVDRFARKISRRANNRYARQIPTAKRLALIQQRRRMYLFDRPGLKMLGRTYNNMPKEPVYRARQPSLFPNPYFKNAAKRIQTKYRSSALYKKAMARSLTNDYSKMRSDPTAFFNRLKQRLAEPDSPREAYSFLWS